MRSMFMVCAVPALLGNVAAGFATQIKFDFDSLDVPRGDFVISNYMSQTYGSEVSTDGARTVRDEDRDDVFIATSLQLLGRGDFEIRFEEMPIVGFQLEGHIIEATPGDDFSFTAYLGTTQVFQYLNSDGPGVFDSGWRDFGGPADRVVISDSGRVDVGIDDFWVMPVPEPGTGAVLLAGAGLALRRRREPA